MDEDDWDLNNKSMRFGESTRNKFLIFKSGGYMIGKKGDEAANLDFRES